VFQKLRKRSVEEEFPVSMVTKTSSVNGKSHKTEFSAVTKSAKVLEEYQRNVV
jgi:hypothetical protein